MCLLVQQQNTLHVKQKSQEQKDKKNNKSENNYHFVLAISQFTIALFFILISWSWNFELFNQKKKFQFNLLILILSQFFFQNSITLGAPFNLGLMLCTHYTLPNGIEYMGKNKVLLRSRCKNPP